MDELYIAITALLASALLGGVKWVMPKIKEKIPGIMMSLVVVGINYFTQRFGSAIPGFPETAGSPDAWDLSVYTVIAGGIISMGVREMVDQINQYLSGKGINLARSVKLPLVLIILCVGCAGTTFRIAKETKSQDTQAILRGQNDRLEAGTGICYGPVWELKSGERWIADFVSVCGMATVSVNEVTTDDKSDTGACFGIMPVNLLGLRGIGCYDPIRNERFFGGALSFTGVTDQLLK